LGLLKKIIVNFWGRVDSAAMARLKQDVDAAGRELTGKVSPRRRPLGRSHSAADQQEAAVQENLQSCLEEKAAAEKIFNLEGETRMLKEALAKRNDELQNARIMCAKTASRLSSVEEEVEALRSGTNYAFKSKFSFKKFFSLFGPLSCVSSPMSESRSMVPNFLFLLFGSLLSNFISNIAILIPSSIPGMKLGGLYI
jgi:hypothetical protein